MSEDKKIFEDWYASFCLTDLDEETAKHYFEKSSTGIYRSIEVRASWVTWKYLKGQKPIVPYYAVVLALVDMTCQYLQRPDGTLFHSFMGAGEEATEVLEQLGLITGEFGVIKETSFNESYLKELFKEY